jgi:DNA invertase Pin-like site-specific DNA recombinase
MARLDRLARNVAFIPALMEIGTDFIACDMPSATRLTIHILAALNEHERRLISKRTKAALAETKRRGTKLGNPRIETARRGRGRPITLAGPRRRYRPFMQGWRRQEWTLRRIAGELNRLNIGPRGRRWYASA